ncbi:MAG: glutamate-cysteine ligase family protein, partial [Candidatus Gastranaerophilales bacterium]|nr:glutamate-cysteine ligase family protein [Candidatus Gastranaerophilales bacterium]
SWGTRFMLLTNNKKEKILEKKQLLEIFFSGCKMQQNIGVESEKLLVYKDSLRAAKYKDVVKILECFDNNKWEKVYNNANITGLKSDKGVISLEPGSQIELSLIPFDNLDIIKDNLFQFYNNLSKYADNYGIKVLDKGIQPVSTYKNIDVIPKQRYEFMTKYLPLKQLEPFIMMRETAGVQVNFDYKSEEDAVKKLALALKMSPFISAIYSNSPVRDSKQTGFKSFRANSWLNVDEQRCGYISKKLFDKKQNFTFSDYAEILLDIPMIFIQRGEEYYGTTKTFREFMKNGDYGLYPVIADWENHISLYFPDVRLKSYIEIRNHDAQNSKMTFSIPAFWKGIMYNTDAFSEIEKILSKYNYEEFMQLRKETPVHGIHTFLGNIKIIDFIKEFFDISYYSLKSNKKDEERYLEPVYEYISMQKMPADDEK